MATYYTVARFCLIFLNLILFVIGVLITLVGFLFAFVPGSIASIDLTDGALHESLNVISINATYLVIAAWICVGLGVIIIIVSLCGCLGGGTLSTTLLAIYVFTMCLITVVQIGVCVVVILSNNWYTDTVNATFLDYLEGGANPEVEQALGALQLAVGCCGVNGTSVYDAKDPLYLTCCMVDDRIAAVADYFNRTEVIYKNEAACTDPKSNGGVATEDAVNDVGCIEKLYENITDYAIIAIALVSIEILIIILGCVVCCKADDERRPI